MNRKGLLLRGRLLLRLHFVVAGFRVKELARGSERFSRGVLIFLTGGDILATIDSLGFLSPSADPHAHADFDFRMHGDRNLVIANGFDRRVQHDLATADSDTTAFK